jgi:hypothetical protein
MTPHHKRYINRRKMKIDKDPEHCGDDDRMIDIPAA